MYPDKQILIVDDEAEFRQLLTSRLSRKGYHVSEAEDGQQALEFIISRSIHLILLDLKMPNMDGMTFLHQCMEIRKDIQIIILTGQGTIESAIEAMKRGAYDYLSKPYNLKELEALITKALERQSLQEENRQLKQVLSSQSKPPCFIAESPAMKNVVATALRVAQSDSPVLLTGESGTGKEVIAHYIFEKSLRHDKPFIPINMGAVSETMMESELFGHEKGAFTGAIVQKKGIVELADQGTLFLDEIGDMPYPLQVKLLRFLEMGEFRRVGGNTLHRVNVRIIAATNAELERRVQKGQFRSDLYYRLKVMDMIIPPLRIRKDDILPLAYFFLDRYKRDKATKTLTEEAKQYLLNYSYPGNVRELGHMVERGVILSSDENVEVTDLFQLPPPMTDVQLKHTSPPLQDVDKQVLSLKELEKFHIFKILQHSKWNKTKTADLLGISVRNLYRKIEEFQISRVAGKDSMLK